jgi:hypothetical protein
MNFPAITTEIIPKAVELLRLFDIRTKQLVLGAQVMTASPSLLMLMLFLMAPFLPLPLPLPPLPLSSQAIQSAARLKNIAAKHLASTSQSIALLVALLPHIRAAFLAHVPLPHH